MKKENQKKYDSDFSELWEKSNRELEKRETEGFTEEKAGIKFMKIRDRILEKYFSD